jgi:hypothetical protein
LPKLFGGSPQVLTTAIVAAAAGAAGSAGRRGAVQDLLNADEVSAAVGRQVTEDAATSQIRLGPLDLETFTDSAKGTPVLMCAVARGRASRLVMAGAAHGKTLAGIGEEAWQGDGWAIARKGEAVVRVNAQPDAGVPPQALATLLATATERLQA